MIATTGGATPAHPSSVAVHGWLAIATSTIAKPQNSVRKDLTETDFQLQKGRHDPCVGVRAGVILESRMSIELMNAVLAHQSSHIDPAHFRLFGDQP